MTVPLNLTPSLLLQQPCPPPLLLAPSPPFLRSPPFPRNPPSQSPLKSTVHETGHPTTPILNTRIMMNALVHTLQDLTTQVIDTHLEDSTHATVPTRPTTTVNIRLHASVYLHISLVLAHLDSITPHFQRHTAVTETTLPPRETYAPPPPLIVNSILLQLRPTQYPWNHPSRFLVLLHQLSPRIRRFLQARLPILHPRLARLRQPLYPP